MPKPSNTQRGFPVPSGKAKVLPAESERVYDQVAVSEGFLYGSGIGSHPTTVHFRFVRYRNTPSGPEEDPTGEVTIAVLENLTAKVADPTWPEAKTFFEALDALAQRVARDQGLF